MNKLSEPFIADKTKPTAERLDDTFNHMRSQLDFLCKSVEWQNEILKELYNNANNGSNQSAVSHAMLGEKYNSTPKNVE
jgi:hypothetical protein